MVIKKIENKSNPDSSDSEWIAFAQVGRPHGVNGAFFLKTSDRRTLWDGYTRLLLSTGTSKVPVKVIKSFSSGGSLALILDALSSRAEVESSYNSVLYVHRSEIQTQQDEYIVSDLLGLRVHCAEKGELGEVVTVLNFGAQETLEIKLHGKQETVYFPFIDAFIKQIDKVTGTIEIVYAPEFFEENKK